MLNQRFIELLTKQLSSEINGDEFDEFQQLLAESESNRQQYELFKNYWEQKDQPYANSDLMFKKIKSRLTIDQQEENIVELPERKKRYLFWRYAAAVIILAFGCLALYKWQVNAYDRVAENVSGLDSTSTKPQSRSYITLTDGTKITLNSESTLKYPATFTGKTREVYLVGEAFFDVHKDHQHPFIIHTSKMNIRVLGTAFNVKAYPMDITTETTLIRGRIEVTINDRPADRIILKPKEKLILKNNAAYQSKSPQHTTESVDTNIEPQYTLTTLTYFKTQDTSVIETAWLKNKLLFRNEDFGTLAERMQRWYGVNIIFNNDDVKHYRFNGIFEKETISQALDALRITEKFHYKIDKQNVFIY
ncbi:FecR family protein [Mucilaginibacter sp.]|uniref:FecR family protein n=1 Tax=Mucilaginibacter sp. TaxID=1882438 RepID=UPI003D0E55CF